MSTVCVIGLGHIGLPTAVTLAQAGHQVIGMDINPRVVDAVNSGSASSHEPGLRKALGAVVRNGSLRASLAAAPADYFIASVPTPLDDNGRPELRHVDGAARAIGAELCAGNTVILESTVPPGTTSGLFRSVLQNASALTAGRDFHLAHCPERVLPGNILKELKHNDRLIGGIDQASIESVLSLYETFVLGEIQVTDPLSAEIAKLAENIYRDVNIALANELAEVAEQLGADFWEVQSLANHHPRVNIHAPGPGVGGYCIPVASTLLLSDVGPKDGLMAAATVRNRAMPGSVAARALELSGRTNPAVAVLGVSYKGNVGDARETPSRNVIELLESAGAEVRAYDPYVTEFDRPLLPLSECVAGADVVLVLADHREFGAIDSKMVAKLVRQRIAFDTRGILDRSSWRAAGFQVEIIGVGQNADAMSQGKFEEEP